MRRGFWLSSLLLVSSVFLQAGAANSQEQSGQEPARIGWFTCEVSHRNILVGGAGQNYFAEPFRASTDVLEPVMQYGKIAYYTFPEPDAEKLIDFLEAMSGLSPRTDFDDPFCLLWDNEQDAREAFSTKGDDHYEHTFRLPLDLLPRKKAEEAVASEKPEQAKQLVAEAEQESTGQTPDKTREQYEAEAQARLAAHEARIAEYQRKVAEREAEIARQQAQHNAALQAAAREQAAYEAKMAAHRRELDEANRRQQEYFAAQRRHSLCLNGDKKMCDDIAAGKPALTDAAEKQEASIDTDANRCVTTAELRLNASFEGNTSASVMNGCGKPVDIRICLMTNSGWNCGIDSAVAPQAQGVHSSFNATGEVFVDARTTGSSRAFANP